MNLKAERMANNSACFVPVIVVPLRHLNRGYHVSSKDLPSSVLACTSVITETRIACQSAGGGCGKLRATSIHESHSGATHVPATFSFFFLTQHFLKKMENTDRAIKGKRPLFFYCFSYKQASPQVFNSGL